MIKRLLRSALVPAGLAVLLLTASDLCGQTNDNNDPGNRRTRRRGNQAQRDPAQAREQMMTRIRERLEVTSDDDWTTLKPLVEKVQQAQREARIGNLGGRRGGNANGNGAGNTGDTNNNNGNNNRRNRPNGGEETPVDPDVAALRAALDSNAPLSELKPKVAKVREVIKQRAAALAKAKEDLRKALTPRQEAIASLLGLLK